MKEEICEKFAKYLLAGEEVIWCGRPGQGLRWRKGDWFFTILSILLFGFTFLFYSDPSGEIFLVFEILFLAIFNCIVFYLFLARHFHDNYIRSKQYYAISKTRIIIIDNKSACSYEIRGLIDISKDHQNTIHLEKFYSPYNFTQGNYLNERTTPGAVSPSIMASRLEFLEDSDAVFDLIKSRAIELRQASETFTDPIKEVKRQSLGAEEKQAFLEYGEFIIWQDKPLGGFKLHPFYVPFLMFSTFAFSVSLLGILAGIFIGQAPIAILLLFFPALIFIVCILPFLNDEKIRKNQKYFITNRRIIIKENDLIIDYKLTDIPRIYTFANNLEFGQNYAYGFRPGGSFARLDQLPTLAKCRDKFLYLRDPHGAFMALASAKFAANPKVS